MFPEGFLSIQRIDCHCDAVSKKSALQQVAGMLADCTDGLSPAEIFQHLLDRERIGATGLGHGIGLPHARIGAIGEARAALLILREGVDYDAVDDEPVDLICGLLVPEDANQQHLKVLASLAELFNDAPRRDRMRLCADPERILSEFKQWEADHPE